MDRNIKNVVKERIVLFTLTLGFCVLLFGCTPDPKEETETEVSSEQTTLKEFKTGTITYSVDFPFFKDQKLKRLLPKEYSLSVSENAMYGEMNSFANIICNRFYSVNDSMVLYQSFDNGSKKFQSRINKKEMDELLSEMPDMVITGEVMDTVILGLNCKKVFAEFQIDSVPPVALYYTKDIKVNNPNWINKYSSVDGFLLGYDLEQFGMRMRLMATDIKEGEYKYSRSSIFGKKVSSDYKILNPDELQDEFKKLLENFSS